MAETVVLTMGELDRLQVMTRIAERRLTRRKAAALLKLSERQVRRVYGAFRRSGAVALASRRRGRPSNRRVADATRERVVTLVRERYADGPTFAHQKLTEDHGLTLSVETLRGWMIAAGFWVPRSQRTRRSYPPRPRRACLGELVQIDGSEHAWFEARGPVCTPQTSTWRLDTELVFHVDGKPMGNLRSELKRTCQHLGIAYGRTDGKVFHDTRHTAKTNLTEAGIPDEVAMTITGHKDVSVFKSYHVKRKASQADALRRLHEHLQHQQPTSKNSGTDRS